MKILFFLSALLPLSSAYAGQSGYIKNGKTYLVFRDGEKVGEYPEQDKRKPNSIRGGVEGASIRFEEDEFARCYMPALNKGSTLISRAILFLKLLINTIYEAHNWLAVVQKRTSKSGPENLIIPTPHQLLLPNGPS